MNEAIIQTAEFYRECTPKFKYNELPPNIPIIKLSNYYSKIQENQQTIQLLLYSLFNHTKEVIKKKKNLFFIFIYFRLII